MRLTAKQIRSMFTLAKPLKMTKPHFYNKTNSRDIGTKAISTVLLYKICLWQGHQPKDKPFLVRNFESGKNV